jgi:hypothetical protein
VAWLKPCPTVMWWIGDSWRGWAKRGRSLPRTIAHPAAQKTRVEDGAPESWLRLHSGLRQRGAHLIDDKAVAKMGHPVLAWRPKAEVLGYQPFA